MTKTEGSSWEEHASDTDENTQPFQYGTDNDDDESQLPHHLQPQPQVEVETILRRTETIMCLFAAVVVKFSLVGIFVVINEWNNVQWTRKLANFLGIALWGLYVVTYIVFHHKQRQRQQETSYLERALAFLRNSSWFTLIISILTGTILALGSISSCGKGWSFYFFFYHIVGFVGAIASLMMWFALPNIIRSRLVGDRDQLASSRHLRRIRKWVAALTVLATLVLPWTTMWLVLYGYSRGNVDDSLFPDSSTSPYLLPFQKGVNVFGAQGNSGAFSHSAGFAYDFMMACGTSVAASRGGTVNLVIDSYNGNYLSGQSRNNIISISHHDDDTTAKYLHVEQGSALVQEGDQVVQGQPIARVGNVGYSTGPHLHFEVSKFAFFRQSSTPIAFQDVTRNQGIPRAFRIYTSGNVEY